MKSILVISNLYPNKKFPHHGTFVRNFFNQLKDDSRVSNVDCCFLKGIPKSIIHKCFAYFVFYIKILFTVLFKHYDIIYVHRITHPVPPLVVTSLFKKLNLVFNIHGSDLFVKGLISNILLKISTPIVKTASHIVVPSEYFLNETVKRFPYYPKNNIIISPSGGVDQKFFRTKNNTIVR